jgi:hypothetical protein
MGRPHAEASRHAMPEFRRPRAGRARRFPVARLGKLVD